MMRIMRRIGILLAALAVAAFVAGPSLAGMNDGGGFQAYSVTAPGSQPTCADAVGAAITAILSGQPVDWSAVFTACQR